MKDHKGKIAVVTGATGGMGRAVATELARSGVTVVTIARDLSRASELREHIDRTVAPKLVEVFDADLSRKGDVRDVAAKILERYSGVDILINNAGALFKNRIVSADGVEMHMAVDYFAAFGLMVFLEKGIAATGGQVVNVVSDTMNDTRTMTIFGRPRPVSLEAAEVRKPALINSEGGFSSLEAYARAKLLTVMAGYEFSRRLSSSGVTVNSVHPGVVATDMINSQIPGFLAPVRGWITRSMLIPEQGAANILRPVTRPELAGRTGLYFIKNAEARTPAITYDADACRNLWQASADYFDAES